MYIGLRDNGELRSEYYTGDEYRKWHRRTEEIDDVAGCMGPCFFMHKARFWETGGCDEGHEGGWGQQGIEVALKAILSGGRLVVNKKTWFAHWFRGDEGFPYPMSGRQTARVREYSKDLWLNDKWPGQKRKFQWYLDKFNPPGWKKEGLAAPSMVEETKIDDKEIEWQEYCYKNIHLKGRDPKWRGIKVIKLPSDFLLYSQVIFDKKPDFIVEIGTAFCGSALYFADMMDINKKGHVISIDISPRGPLIPHDRITYLNGDSKSPEIIKKIKELVGDKSVMVSIDGDHHRVQVKWELKLYSDIVTTGQYMVVEDCFSRHATLTGPGEARDWFMHGNKKFIQTNMDKQFIVGFTKGGWLLKNE